MTAWSVWAHMMNMWASDEFLWSISAHRMNMGWSNLARLQLARCVTYLLVQNTLARVVTEKSCFCHITHWLPVRHRINFKIATITLKVLQFQRPSYLAAPYSTVCAGTITTVFFLVNMCSYTKKRDGNVQIIFICCLIYLEQTAISPFIHFHSSCFQEETQASPSFECLSR